MLGVADYGAFAAGNTVLSAARSLAYSPPPLVGPGPDSRLHAASAGAHA
jgi:hypothetical protein